MKTPPHKGESKQAKVKRAGLAFLTVLARNYLRILANDRQIRLSMLYTNFDAGLQKRSLSVEMESSPGAVLVRYAPIHFSMDLRGVEVGDILNQRSQSKPRRRCTLYIVQYRRNSAAVTSYKHDESESLSALIEVPLSYTIKEINFLRLHLWLFFVITIIYACLRISQIYL